MDKFIARLFLTTALALAPPSGLAQSVAVSNTAKLQSIYIVTDPAFAGGAKCDGTTDDTAAIQAAITAAKAAGAALLFPPGRCRVTLSLNATASSNEANFWMVGQGRRKSVIVCALTERYPCLDMSGNTRGGIRSLGVDASTSAKATAAVLIAKGAAGGSIGNNQSLEDCFLSGSASATANMAALVVYNADLTHVSNCEVVGNTGGGATFGLAKPSAVTSKYLTLPATSDSTNFYISDSTFTGAAAPALEYTGGAAISLINVYAAITGGGGVSGVIQVSSPSRSSGNSIYAHDLRVENQSSAKGVAAIYLKAQSNYSSVDGELESDERGYMIASDTAIVAKHWQVNIAAASAKFANAVKFNGLRGSIHTAGVGAPDSSSFGVKVSMDVGRSAFYRVFGAGAGNELMSSNDNADFKSMNSALIPPTSTSQQLRPSGAFSQAAIATKAYTGGSGERLVYAYSVPGAMLQSWGSMMPVPTMLLEFVGTTSAASGAGGRIRVELAQGAGKVDCLDTGANVRAGQGNLRLTVKVYSVGSTNSRSYCELVVTPNATLGTAALFSKFTNTQGTIALNADFAVNIYTTNTGNSPYSYEVQTGLLQ